MDRMLGWHRVRTATAVLKRFGDAGGGLLAGGLTYSALFALLPTLLLVTAVLGFIVEDPARRSAIVTQLGEQLPPLRDFLEASLAEIARGAGNAGIIGLVGLAWGASRFYGSLDEAFARIFTNAPRRGFIRRTVRGILSVVLLVLVVAAALTLTGVASFVAAQTEEFLSPLPLDVLAVVSPLLAAVVFVGATLAVYRIVPAREVSWASALLPALCAGVVIALLTQLFSFIAPRLIGVAAVFGSFVAVFAAMVWMATSFQVLLIGAAWVRERLGPPPPAFLDGA